MKMDSFPMTANRAIVNLNLWRDIDATEIDG